MNIFERMDKYEKYKTDIPVLVLVSNKDDD